MSGTEEPGAAIDAARLGAWMSATLGGPPAPVQLTRLRGGQSNPTYLVTRDRDRYVLRRKPGGALLQSAHAVDREYRVMAALAASDVPVACVPALCEDDAVIGTAFYLMEFVEGRVLWDPALPGIAPAERIRMYDDLNRVIAALHSIDPAAIGLEGFGPHGQYIARQVSRWSRQYQASATGTIEAMERLMVWLPEHVPADDETRIVHGDFRLDNVIFHPNEPRIVAVLDWELSTLGSPLADFAYQCMVWRLEPGLFRGLVGHDLAALGIPTESEHVAAYGRRTGRAAVPSHDWEYYMVFNMFRLAAIMQGIMARAIAGNAASSEAVEMGRRARPLAELAWRQVERLQS
jgi:aminoglycoside phosphotransferase (APT) family kinase protein